jgi:transposase
MNQRFTEEFKVQAVKQVIEQGYSVASVADRLGMSTHSLYNLIKKFGPEASQHQELSEQEARIRQLEKELKRVTQERDILKEAAVFFAEESKKNTRS